MKRLILTSAVLLAFLTGASADNNPFHDSCQWTVVPNHADWLYKTGEKASLKLTLLKYGMPAEGKVVYTVSDDMLEPEVTDSLILKNGSATIDVGTGRKPGFREIRLYHKDGENTSQYCLKLGFDVPSIAPLTKEPKDFGEFWKKAVDEAEATPLSYTAERMEDFSTGKTDCFKVKLKTVGSHHVYGYLYKPKGAAAGSCPVMTIPPGAGIKTILPHNDDDTAIKGCINFQFEIHGIDPELSPETYQDIRSAMASRPCSYYRLDLNDKDNYYMRHVYQALVKVIDLLTAQPEWDGRNVIAYGGSQGGALSLISTGIDSRVTQCISFYPAMVEMIGYSVKGATGGYPHFNRDISLYTPKALETLPYYDVISFARHIKVPVFLSFGYCDPVCPPTTSYMVWNTLNCPKELFTMPYSEHWSNAAGRTAALDFIGSHLL